MAGKSYERVTFLADSALVEKLRDYAYTERVTIRSVMDMLLSDFLKDKTGLLSHRREKATV